MPDGAISEMERDLMERARRVLPGGTFGNTGGDATKAWRNAAPLLAAS
jgi:hypothetical protein